MIALASRNAAKKFSSKCVGTAGGIMGNLESSWGSLQHQVGMRMYVGAFYVNACMYSTCHNNILGCEFPIFGPGSGYPFSGRLLRRVVKIVQVALQQL